MIESFEVRFPEWHPVFFGDGGEEFSRRRAGGDRTPRGRPFPRKIRRVPTASDATRPQMVRGRRGPLRGCMLATPTGESRDQQPDLRCTPPPPRENTKKEVSAETNAGPKFVRPSGGRVAGEARGTSAASPILPPVLLDYSSWMNARPRSHALTSLRAPVRQSELFVIASSENRGRIWAASGAPTTPVSTRGEYQSAARSSHLWCPMWFNPDAPASDAIEDVTRTRPHTAERIPPSLASPRSAANRGASFGSSLFWCAIAPFSRKTLPVRSNSRCVQ